ncbi:MAG: hypothetical protein A2747_03020 [Candidatus Yonathbacteria bacterium RIFCSPHIGHO2_01_FULL_44_41]|uniref:Uncharacterized protein n=1 Tax=Candidatus Yonathbacteria bacterium RIFCSPHIGHO2_02_FULL_44_14 TaxID=1802724 RepID=A0A1G2S5X1_9BACT|nr:MAG: hypothetical protein A2747_03020 [Candidatus Yonathbacteria bacterium RIFCSPHIGHO2_01_FULL_44_41]OHA80524.1 MAG: hypothetical protein A3D51_00370 [Candidatus Yonathbacteria bacterium RIFCSPHIGHO2_02_FULL_44_14]OHA82185.1 MAG: hypothetical protein A3B06_01625 [Candidatus Yonathbacteria bacterium RIFCSPLOWO2_01_FULL_43_20]
MKETPVEDTAIRDGAIFLGIVLLVYVSTNITPITFSTVASGEAPAILLALLLGKVDPVTIQNFFLSLHSSLAVLGILFLAGSFWATLKIREIHHKEQEKYEPIHLEEVAAKEKFTQWQVILDHVNSESPAEWKLAILEADNILDEILEDQGYTGETVAEKLKTMSPTKIASYDDIWAAHKLRNQIAHGGAIDMDLSKKSARDAITKFEKAFKELGYL